MKVLVFGTFDLLHPGHEYFFREAKKHGDKLYVIVARDQTVETVKGKTPIHDEQRRMENISGLEYIDEVMLGSLKDRYEMIQKVRPDVICLGYDQKHFTQKLKEELAQRNLHPKIIRLGSHEPHRHKSSILREMMGK